MPTIALSQPILKLLANESAPAEAKPPEPMPISQEPALSESTASVVAVEIETAAPLAVSAIPTHERPPAPKKRKARLIAAFAVAGVLLGTGAWARSHGTWKGSLGALTESTSAVASLLKAAHFSGRSADLKPATAPTPSRPDVPVPTAPTATEGAAADPSALSPAPAPLLAVDGSERPAPTCDDLLATPPSEVEKALDPMRAARQAFVRGDVDGSQRGFCRAMRATPANAVAASELAQVLILRRDAAAAVPWAQETVRLEPGSPRALTLLGDSLVRTGNLDEARKAWLAASKLAEDDRAGIDRMAQGALAAADRALKERDPARAERLLRKVIAFQPENAAAHITLGVALTRLGFAQSAAAWTQRGAELSAAK